MNTFARLFPYGAVAFLALYMIASVSREWRSYTYREFDLAEFAALPVLDGGRIKPLDSVARAAMLRISGRSDFVHPDGGTRPAILWLLEVMAADGPDTSAAADYRIFRIDNEQLLLELELPYRPGSYRYSLNEIRAAWPKFLKALAAAEKTDEQKRDLFHAKVIELANRLRVYEQLSRRHTPTVVAQKPGSLEWVSLFDVDEPINRVFAGEAHEQAQKEVIEELRAAGVSPARLTPQELTKIEAQIDRRTEEILRGRANVFRKEVSPAAAAFADILAAYRENRPKGFAEAIAAYKAEHLRPLNPALRDTSGYEMAYQLAAPFYYAPFVYVFAAVCVVLSWLGWSGPFRKAAFALALLGLALELFGLGSRMYLMGRPLVFVTNLYSTTLLISAAAVATGLLIDRMDARRGLGLPLLAGCVLAAVVLNVAHFLTLDGSDNLGTLVAVLDTNFWLASHVTTVTLGYSATYLAGLLGVVYILWGLFLPTLTREKHAALGNMIYGVTCFATLLSFVGTVLGGIWADQSWGRFWGWDPKENGAVLIVIWNTLILHARWGGMVKQRGLAVLAVVGIMVTTWSWFGTNQLGVGLHNYGFNKSLAEGCMWTWIASGVVIALGLIPLRYWRSFAGTGQPRSEGSPLPASGAVSGQPQPNSQAADGSPARGKKPGRRR